jgi:hypothetical protein
MHSSNCANCTHPLNQEQSFCEKCGQEVNIHRISFGHIIHEGVHFLTHADKGIFFLLKELALRPGHVAREYIEGKRKKYMPPVSFFLIMVGLFVLATNSFKTFERSANFAQVKAMLAKEQDVVKRERRLAKITRAEQATKFMNKNSNLVSLLVATPFVTLIFFLFYIRRRYNYIEHLIANFYFAGFSALFFIFIVAPLFHFVNSSQFYFSAITCFLIFEIIYRSIAYYQFMNRRGAKDYLFALLPSAVAVVLWSALSYTIIEFYISTGFKNVF